MRRAPVVMLYTLWGALLAGYSLPARAVVNDADLCFGSGSDCIVLHKVTINDPEGVDVRPLTLRIKPFAAILAPDSPETPLIIRAGHIVIEKGGRIGATVSGAKGNSITLIADTVTVLGTIDASSLRVNVRGGDGGAISVTSAGACLIAGKVTANGARAAAGGGSGGEIAFECGSVEAAKGARVEANGSGLGGLGGNVAFNAARGTLSLLKGSTVRVVGSALDGGAISLVTNANDPNASCLISGKLFGDAKSSADMSGAGGSLDVSCGGDITVANGALLSFVGADGGGSVDILSGGNLLQEAGTRIRTNSSGASGGAVDIVAANDVTIQGWVESRSGGLFGNDDGSISVTNGGSLVIAKRANLNASASRKYLQSGQIVLAGGLESEGSQPSLVIEKGAQLRANGHAAGLGVMDIDVSGSLCKVGGTITADASTANAPIIGLVCDSVTLEQTARIASRSSGAFGGSLVIDTTGELTGNPGGCVIGGRILLNAVSIKVLDPRTHTTRAIPGHGGSVDANCGQGLSLPERALINVGATGPQSVAGQVTLSANEPLDIRGSIKAKAAGKLSAGGRVAVAAPDVLLAATTGTIDASADRGGTIEITATGGTGGSGDVAVHKLLNVKGTTFGGNVMVAGCHVDIGGRGWLRADGTSAANSGGINEVRARNQLAVLGKMTALSGQNLLLFSSAAAPVTSGTIRPAASLDSSLSPCP